MKYGYTIIYVRDVEKTLEFYRDAFGFGIKFIHESKDYGELETGETVLAFASHQLGEINFDGKYLKGGLESLPYGTELAFVTEDVDSAMTKAIAHGALLIKAATAKPWGQIVGYVRAIDGSIVELCSPIAT
ncbi:MAG: VOC family protein [Cyanobacteria bacterium J06600_6]